MLGSKVKYNQCCADMQSCSLRKWKNKYIIQFLKVESPPFTTYFGKLPTTTTTTTTTPYGLPRPIKMKKMLTPLKKNFENQKVVYYNTLLYTKLGI